MSFLMKIISIAAMLLSLSACTMDEYVRRDPVADLPYRHSDFDFKVAWKTYLTDQGLNIEGLLKNVRYAQVESVTLYVSLLNSENKVLASDRTFPIPQTIKMDYYVPFDVILKNAAPQKGDRLKFVIDYKAQEGNEGASRWISYFTVDALTGIGFKESIKDTGQW
ncbi:MAG: hypothetical protein FD174_936 [Geobacteraceae bacterium]|nr:MAG: hypothetical protein FD174_936 [Geobacteraceae bacterium]